VTGDPALSVVVPAFDEGDRILDTVKRLRSELAGVAGGCEIIVVDDGSGDDTTARARDAGADKVLVHARNRGKGAAVRTGVLGSSGRIVVFTDADLAYSPDQVRALVEAVEAGSDVVIGCRSHPDSEAVVAASRLRALGSRMINLITRLVLRGRYGDTQSGIKGFRGEVARSVFERTRLDRMGFDIEVLVIAERDGLQITEVPVRVVNSTRSSVHIVRDGVGLVRDVMRVRWWAWRGEYDRRPRQ
jgi:glycosyltransferase involved in cell wall biosynthesis